jgi:hypothetical protein
VFDDRMDSSDFINYVAFLKEIKGLNDYKFNETRTAKDKTCDYYSSLHSPKVYSIQEALVELNNELTKRKVRLHDVMLENDNLRRGCVPLNKFRNILQK